MAGFAAVIDFENSIREQELERMLERIPHRATGGVRSTSFTHAAIGETRTAIEAASGRWHIARRGSLAIVGDIRLIHRDRLRGRAGGRKATEGLDDRELILAAWERHGVDALDAIDGEFGFVVWDDGNRIAYAVRDRFGTVPVYIERTPTGARLAIEIKQLAGTSPQPPSPNRSMIAEYLLGSFRSADATFYDGIDRVRASDVVEVTSGGVTRRRYWVPSLEPDTSLHGNDIVDRFKGLLVDSVGERSARQPIAAHMSGGLDSTSVVAAGSLLTSPVEPTTISWVYPGFGADESPQIAAMEDRFGYRNIRIEHAFASVDEIVADMRIADTPRVSILPGQPHRTAEMASSLGIGSILTGTGGDYVADADRVPDDLLRARHPFAWLQAVRERAAWLNTGVHDVASSTARNLTPGTLRTAYRKVRPAASTRTEALGPELKEIVGRSGRRANGEPGRSSRSAASAIAAEARSPLLTLTHELTEPVSASHGVRLTHPFLDRTLYEFVLAIPATAYPLDGSSKPLLRKAFSRELPPQIRDRRTKSIIDPVLLAAFDEVAPELAARFPSVPDPLGGVIEDTWYRRALQDLLTPTDRWEERGPLWDSWTVMLWAEHPAER